MLELGVWSLSDLRHPRVNEVTRDAMKSDNQNGVHFSAYPASGLLHFDPLLRVRSRLLAQCFVEAVRFVAANYSLPGSGSPCRVRPFLAKARRGTASAVWNCGRSANEALLNRLAKEARSCASSARGIGIFTSSGPRIFSRLAPTKLDKSVDGAPGGVGVGGGINGFLFLALADHTEGAVTANAAIVMR
jgi:hypothetical protein